MTSDRRMVESRWLFFPGKPAEFLASSFIPVCFAVFCFQGPKYLSSPAIAQDTFAIWKAK